MKTIHDTQPPAESEPVPHPTARSHPFDPPSELGWFREHQPLRRLAYHDGHVGWLVTSHALACTLLADPRFSSRVELMRQPVRTPFIDIFAGKPPPPGLFIGMDQPEHTRFRRLLTAHFTVQKMNALRPQIEQIVARQLDAMERSGPPAELVETFALPIPSLAICELLGVPGADRAAFERNSLVLMSLESTPEQGAAAYQAIADYLRELIQHKRIHPTDDLLGYGCGLVGSGELTVEELLGIGVFMLLAGHETTANMLALGVFALLRHPDQLAQLQADPALIQKAIEELLRYLSIGQFGLNRTALEDVELAGRLIKAGESVSISMSAANRDPAKFNHPDQLDLTRVATGHLGFGRGIHACIGQQLSRVEMQIAYPALFRRFPTLRLAVPPEEVPMRSDSALYGVHRLPVTWDRAS